MSTTQTQINGKQLSDSILGKRKKVREKRSNYLQKWLEKSMQHTSDIIPEPTAYDNITYANMTGPGYWNAPHAGYGQRLFNATSDPSVCRYSAPFNYSTEPISLPVYPPTYHSNIPPIFHNPHDWGAQPQQKYPQPNPNKSVRNRRRPKKSINRKYNIVGIENDFSRNQNGHASPVLTNTRNPIITDPRSNTSSSVTGTNNEFASLPPVVSHPPDNPFSSHSNDDTEKSGNHRRFSDPGMGPGIQSLEASQEDSAEDSESESSSVLYGGQPDNRLIMCLVDQINSLKESNRKLYKELHETRGELDILKQQSSLWRGDNLSAPRLSPQSPLNSQPGGLSGPSMMYAPGMLADLVREIRDAARIREEALYTKVRSLMDERNSNKTNGNSSLDKGIPDWRHYDHLKSPAQYTPDKSRSNDRLGKLEEAVQNIRLNISRDDLSSPSSLQNFSQLGHLEELHQSQGNQAIAAEQERMRLRMELSDERAARAAANAHAHKLELLVTHLRSKRGGSAAPSPGPQASDPLHLVLGPVTDL